jgi:hypothetical protein
MLPKVIRLRLRFGNEALEGVQIDRIKNTYSTDRLVIDVIHRQFSLWWGEGQ